MDHCACDRSDGSFANAGVSDKDITPNREGFGRCISFSSRKRRREDFDARLLRVATPQRCCSTLSSDEVCATADVYGKASAGGRGGGPTAEGAVLSIGEAAEMGTADDVSDFRNEEIAATRLAAGVLRASPMSPASDVGVSQTTVVDKPGPEMLRCWKQSAAAFAARSLHVVRNEADPCASYARDVETYVRAVHAALVDECGLTCTDTLEGAGCEVVEEYYTRLTEATYDTARLFAVMGLDGVHVGGAGDGEASAYVVLKEVFTQFLTSCVEGAYDDEMALSEFVKSLPLMLLRLG